MSAWRITCAPWQTTKAIRRAQHGGAPQKWRSETGLEKMPRAGAPDRPQRPAAERVLQPRRKSVAEWRCVLQRDAPSVWAPWRLPTRHRPVKTALARFRPAAARKHLADARQNAPFEPPQGRPARLETAHVCANAWHACVFTPLAPAHTSAVRNTGSGAAESAATRAAKLRQPGACGLWHGAH